MLKRCFKDDKVLSKFLKHKLGVFGACGICFLLLIALLAPFIANNRPLIYIKNYETIEFPFLYFFFAPDGSEQIIEKIFNFAVLYLPLFFCIRAFCGKYKKVTYCATILGAILLLLPFITTSTRLDKTDWHTKLQEQKGFAVRALIPYGPYEQKSKPYLKPSKKHLLGTDQVGRDVLSRMVYGTRVSLATGIFATLLSLLIGTSIGICAGFFKGKVDLLVMRFVEIVLCFPTFLLLLVLMSMLRDIKVTQSILLLILVLGFTSWIGLCRLVRGETLRQCALPYIASCEVTGIPLYKIFAFHILPNIMAPILISFSFGVAEAIVAESSLSFLGFGVEPPTASWGELLHQAFSDRFEYWHLTVCPGVALFIAVCSFNFLGEAVRHALDPHT